MCNLNGNGSFYRATPSSPFSLPLTIQSNRLCAKRARSSLRFGSPNEGKLADAVPDQSNDALDVRERTPPTADATPPPHTQSPGGEQEEASQAERYTPLMQ